MVMIKGTILLLCTGNACRSQMAEGVTRKRLGRYLEVHSAGTHPAGVHPYARMVLEELGVDPAEQYSKHVAEIDHIQFDLMVTLCDSADRACPVVQNSRDRVHLPFDDPIYAVGTEEEVLDAFRKSRDDIERRLIPFLSTYFDLDIPPLR